MPAYTGAYLSGARLRGAFLQGADLRGVHLKKDTAHGSGVKGIHLNGAELIGANLSTANLQGAELSEADLRGAILKGALNWKPMQLIQAIYSADTVMPDGSPYEDWIRQPEHINEGWPGADRQTGKPLRWGRGINNNIT